MPAETHTHLVAYGDFNCPFSALASARVSELERLGAGPADRAVADDWRAAWSEATTPIVPVLVLPDGYVSRGLGALSRLAAMLDG